MIIKDILTGIGGLAVCWALYYVVVAVVVLVRWK